MNSLKLIIPAVIIFILALGGIYYLYQSTHSQLLQPGNEFESSASATPNSSAFPKTNAQPAPSATPAANGTTKQQPSTGPEDEIMIRNEGITSLNPTAYTNITSPVTVGGIANVTSQSVTIEIHDAGGNILGQGQAQACVGINACPFKASVVFSSPSSLNGNIVLYSPSQLDGSPTYLQQIPVTFR